MLLKLECFQYAMPLNLNMGNYHIRLSKNTSNLCMIIITWGKYCYKLIPKGIKNSPDIFQQEMNDLFHEFEYIRAYIDEILILIKGYWIDHVHILGLTKKN